MSRDWKLVVYFEADSDEQAGVLGEAAMDAATEALGCADDAHDCLHFRLATLRPTAGSRRRAIRFALEDLWGAIRSGEC